MQILPEQGKQINTIGCASDRMINMIIDGDGCCYAFFDRRPLSKIDVGPVYGINISDLIAISP